MSKLKALFIIVATLWVYSCGNTENVFDLADHHSSDGKQNGDEAVATLEKTETHWTYSVSLAIDSDLESIWNLLTDSSKFHEWNSTISKIEGRIALGEKIKVFTAALPDRAFEVTVTKYTQNQEMVWSDQLGARTFRLSKTDEGKTVFFMSEKLLAQVAGNVPDMRSVFERYAEDLKAAGEGQ